jgi:hypothetical protein
MELFFDVYILNKIIKDFSLLSVILSNKIKTKNFIDLKISLS